MSITFLSIHPNLPSSTSSTDPCVCPANTVANTTLPQRFQPPTLFCIKISIILFNVSVFQTRIFKKMSIVVAIMTFIWMIGSFLGTLLQCSPPSYFWNKNQEGRCITNTLLTIGLTSAVLSCVGDVVIYVMPIPLLVKLNLNKSAKLGVLCVFALGLLYVLSLTPTPPS